MSMFSGGELGRVPANGVTGSSVAWALLGIPAVLSWLAVAVVWLIEPRLAVEVNFLAVAMWTGISWYALLILLFGGWLGLVFLAGVL